MRRRATVSILFISEEKTRKVKKTVLSALKLIWAEIDKKQQEVAIKCREKIK